MYVPPRFLSNQVRGYEKVKQQTLKENLAKMDAKGIKNMPNLSNVSKSLFGSKQSGNTKGTDKGKNQIGRGDDDADYVPSDGEGRLGSSSEEDDSSGSRTNKVRSTGLGMKKGRSGPGMKKGRSPIQLLRKSLGTQEQGHSALQTQPPAVVAECMSTLAAQPSQLPTSPTEQINPFCSPNTAVGSGASSQIVSKKRGRGPTRGKNVDKLRKILGQPIPVDINPETMSIEGEHATSVAYAIGLNIRDHAPVRDIGWGDIDFGIRESIVMRVGQIFGIGDYKNDMVVRRVIDIKCQSLYSDWKCELHNHYKYLKEKKVSDLKSHALYPCNPNDWVFMIENVWETEDWKKKSLKGQKARSFLKFNHTSGSRSFASRASIYVKKNSKKQPFTDNFKETHIRHRVGNEAWINDKAKECHEEMVRLTSEQSQPNVTNPLSEEQISVKVLGKRSGYLKGYGIRKNTKFLNAMPSQAIPNPEVVELKKQLDDQAKAMAAMADKAKMFEQVILMMAMKSGIDPTCIPGLVTGSGNEEDTWVGEQDDEDSD